MKKVFAFFATMLLAAAASAQSAAPTLFKDSANNSFSADDVFAFECTATGYKLQAPGEYTVLPYTDSSNICTRFTSAAYVQANFIQVNGTQRYLNTTKFRRVYVESGNTKIMTSGGVNDYTPGTVLHSAILARSN